MRVLTLLLLSLLTCPLAALVAPTVTPAVAPTWPTLTPAALVVAAPRVEISATAQALSVGDTVTITGVPVNIGLPYYTLTLTSGGSFTITYYDELRAATPDALFELAEAHGEMNRVTFTLRTLAPGSAEATVSATGEVTTPEGAFMWGSGTSIALTLSVTG